MARGKIFMENMKSRILGALYGMACGDAMGVPTSFMSQEYIAKRWGWIDTFLPPEPGHIFHDGLTAGEYTDDSEQAVALMNSYIRNGKVVPHDVVNEILLWAERVKDKYVSPLGPSTAKALKAIKEGADITVSGRYADSNGSAMRISPMGIIHGLRGSSMDELVRDVYMTCMPTHNTAVCVSGACAVAMGVKLCIEGERNLDEIVRQTMAAADRGREYGYDTAAPMISKRIAFACDIADSSADIHEGMKKLYWYFGGGDLIADSVPASIALFVLGRGDPKKVIEICVNFGGDCDTNAAMAGAMAGAYSGLEAIPGEWVETIKTVNKIDMEPYADRLIGLAPDWEPAAESDCKASFYRLN